MSELVEFIRGCLDADEQPTWTLVPYQCEPGCCAPAGWVGAQCRYCDAAPVYGGTVEAMTASAEEHAERIHQRARVLAEVNAKRAILDLHQPDALEPDICAVCASHAETYPCRTVRALAQPYAGEPGWRDEWGTQ